MFRSLIIAPPSIREAVMSQPLVATLARRGEVVAVAAHPAVAPVYRAMGSAVAQVYELPFRAGRLDLGARRDIGRNWQRRFDVAYVLPDLALDALLPWFAGVPRRIGYHGQHRHLLINERVPEPVPPGSIVARYLALAGEAAAAGAARPLLPLDPGRIGAAAQARGLKPGAYWVLAPGGDDAPSRCWPPARFAELIGQLQRRDDHAIVLIGSGREVALAEHIAAQAAPAACQVLAGLTSVDETLALIAGATGLVSNDTGWLQLGAATGVPLVGLFGSTSPDRVAPLPLQARTIRIEPSAGLVCAPCGDSTCRPGHLLCLEEISAAQVLEALLTQVRRAATDAGGLRLAAVAAQDDTDPPRRVVGRA